MVRGQRTEVGGQKSDDRGQKDRRQIAADSGQLKIPRSAIYSMRHALPVLSLSKDALCFFKSEIRNYQTA